MVQKSPGHDLNPSLLFPLSVIDPWAVVHIFWEIVPYSDVGLEGFKILTNDTSKLFRLFSLKSHIARRKNTYILMEKIASTYPWPNQGFSTCRIQLSCRESTRCFKV